MIVVKNFLFDLIFHFLFLLILLYIFKVIDKIPNFNVLMYVFIIVLNITFINHKYFPNFTISRLFNKFN